MAVMSRTKLLLVCTFFAVAAAIDVGGTCANGGSCAKDGTTQTSQPSAEVPVVDTFGLIQSTHTLAQKIGVNLGVTPTDLPKDTAQKKDSPTAAKERVQDVLKKVAMPFNMHRFMELDISAHEMREMLGANFTPETAGIIQDVINTLAKHLEDNVKRDQESAKQEVVTRIGDLTEKTNSAVAQKTEGDNADISHSTCVTEEVQLLTAHKTCTDEETKLKEEKPSLEFCGNSILQPVDYPNSPELIELLTKDISIDYSDDISAINSQLDAHAAEVKLKVDTWIAAQKLIAETKKGEWTTANQKCIDKTKELTDKTAECGDKLAAWQLQHEKCLHEKSAQQLAVCGFGYKYQIKCGSKTEYDNTRAGITGTGTDLSEPDREKEWTHFTRMMCVLETFKTTIELDSSAVDACTKSDDEAAADFTADVGRIDLQEDVYGELTSEAKFTCTETHITFGNGDLWTVPENTNDVAEWLPTADEYTKETGYAYAIKSDVSNPPFEFCMGSGDHPTAPTCGSAFDCSAGSGSAKPATTPCHLDTGCTSADCCEDMFPPAVPAIYTLLGRGSCLDNNGQHGTYHQDTSLPSSPRTNCETACTANSACFAYDTRSSGCLFYENPGITHGSGGHDFECYRKWGAAYVKGTPGTNTCPAGYLNIVDKSACTVAASALNMERNFHDDDRTDVWDSRPKGCWNHALNEFAYMNGNPGTPSTPDTLAAPICQKA